MASIHMIRNLQRIPTVTNNNAALFVFQHRLASHAATVRHGEVCPEDQKHGHHYVPGYRHVIEDREIVGYGSNGDPKYGDSFVWPYCAIRFRRPDQRYKDLALKEKSDWKNLTKDEKKELYRYNYCETFAEFMAPHGHWRSIIGIMCFWISLSLWAFILQKKIYPPLPESFDDEHRLAQLKRMIDLRVNPVDGLASKWDYEKGRWKE